MNHQIKCAPGTDPRNHIVTCECGWKYSGTYKGVRERGDLHTKVFAFEDRRWNDPRRHTEMPSFAR